jgi:hypothetical protein
MTGNGSTSPGYESTEGRLAYLRKAGLEEPQPGWWQGPAGEGAGVGDRNLDFMATIEAHQWIDVPQDLLGDGMEPFRQRVRFKGAPLAGEIGDADTIMERLDPIELEVPVRTRLVAFGNVSVEPIELRGTGPLAGRYHLYVTLSPTAESPGETRLFGHGDASGAFASQISLAPLFELRPVDGGESLFVDTGQIPIPGFPMDMASSGGIWSRVPPRSGAVASERGQSLFYPGKVSIVTQKMVKETPDGDDIVLAGCEKKQAYIG